jgi:orotate phosphoribosyltransferase
VVERERDRLFQLLRTRAFQRREVTLSSGLRSNFYIDCKQVSLDAEGAYLIGQLFHSLIERVAPEAVAVGGLTLGADPLATATSIASFVSHAAGAGRRPLQAFIVRKEPKGHGTNQWVESPGLPQGSPVVVLEDVITTGASTLKAIDGAEAAGLRVVHAVGLVDRREGGAAAVQARVPLATLFTRHDFMPEDA